MSLFYQLDKHTTKQNAKAVLTNYRRLRQVAGGEFLPNVTATYSFEPRNGSSTNNNAMERHIVRKMMTENKMKEIEDAINKLELEDRYILIRKYCQKHTSDIEIYMDFEMSESEFYRQLEKAYCAFAEVYRSGELLVFENGLGIDDFLGGI